MPSFSERHDLSPKKIIQSDNINDDLKIALWNVFFNYYLSFLPGDIKQLNDKEREFYFNILLHFCKIHLDTIDSWIGCHNIKNKLKDCGFFGKKINWWKIYDFIEYVATNDFIAKRSENFQDSCNLWLKNELSAYRFVEGRIARITSESEITEIETAINQSSDKVAIHLQQALILLSNRESPDYRNSIKESISAVEAQCKIICEEPTPTLTKSLEIIQRRGRVKIHPNLNDAFQKIYSWTNDDEGIRHSLKDEPTVDQEDAQFMLIACSAFINYLQVKKMKSDS